MAERRREETLSGRFAVAAESKHFRLLDGLRGLAAIAVVGYHFGGRADLPYLLPRGYLAVDFFFVLSGVVLAYAYGERLRTTLTSSRFIVQRLVRLLPVLVPGTLFGAVIELWRPGAVNSLSHLQDIVGIAILGCLALPWPFPTPMEFTIFPINGPVWSLFFELFANLVFVVVAKTAFPRAAPLLLMLVGAVWIGWYAGTTGSLDVGPLLLNWTGGFPRVLYSFFAGIMVFAYRDRFPALAPWIFPVALLAVFLVPAGGGAFGVAFDLILVLLAFPMMVGAASKSQPRGLALRICRLAGDISYPLYAVHYPIIRAICFVINKYGLTLPARLGLAAASIVLVVGISWLVFRFYDRPLRHSLMRRLEPSGGPDGTASGRIGPPTSQTARTQNAQAEHARTRHAVGRVRAS